MPERFRIPGTVRWRVTAVATLAVAAVLIVTGVLLVGAQRRILDEQLDEALEADADRIVARYVDDPESAVRALDPGGDDDAVAQIMTPDGEVVARSPGAPATPFATWPSSPGDEFATEDGVGDEDESFRLLARRFEAPDGTDRVLAIASPRDDIVEAVGALTVALWLGIPLVTAVLAALIWVMVGRTLRPVDRIRAEVSAIGPTELGRRVPEPPGGDEIARLASTMNAMLDRLDASARRQRQFTGDASHELRTPLTRLRTEIEVELRQRPDDEFTLGLLLEVDGMQQLIDDLLVLARGDDDADAALHRPVDLDDIVLEEIGALDGDRVTVDARRVSGAQVLGAPEQLRRVVRNLLDNAAHHASSQVTVSLNESREAVTLTVTDDGAGIPTDRHDEVFERFRRLDEARSGDAGGTGLGLAIARDVVERHGGTIAIDADHHPGARFVVTLPSQAAGPTGDGAAPMAS